MVQKMLPASQILQGHRRPQATMNLPGLGIHFGMMFRTHVFMVRKDGWHVVGFEGAIRNKHPLLFLRAGWPAVTTAFEPKAHALW